MYTADKTYDILKNYHTDRYADRHYPFTLYKELTPTAKREIKNLAEELLNELDRMTDNEPSEVYQNICLLLQNRIIIAHDRNIIKKSSAEITQLKRAIKVMMKIEEEKC